MAINKSAVFYARRISMPGPATPQQGSLRPLRDRDSRYSGLYAAQARSIRSAWFGWLVFCTLVVVQGCRAPSPDWSGTWKLNSSESNFHGPIFTISISADEEYRYDDGNSSFTFHCDGKDRPIGKDRTQACVKSSATTIDLTRKENGIKINTYHWELSDGGKVFSSTVTAFRPSGPMVTNLVAASRISGSNNFAGQWRDTSYLQRHADMTLRLDSHTLYIGYPTAGQEIDAPLDGIEVVVRGPRAPEGTTYSAQSVGRREIRTFMKRNGKVLTQGSLKLSNDGKIITESWWNPDRPSDQGTLVYDRK